jgi:hypothetical protein
VKDPEPQACRTLKPFNREEAISIKEAAAIAGKSERTLYEWCKRHGLGRRVGSGTWWVSKVALAMFLDDDMIALAAYQAGDRTSDLVSLYFDRFGLNSQCFAISAKAAACA